MNKYAIKPGVILYNYARNRCYLVLERCIDWPETWRFIDWPEAWRCIYRDENGRYRIFYISEMELMLAQDGIWKALSGINLADVYLNSIIQGGEAGYETLKKTFNLAEQIVRKIKYNTGLKKENA